MKTIEKTHKNGTEIKGESVVGRLTEILEKHGHDFVENLIDSQLLQHDYSAAALAEATKSNDKVGVNRLPTEPREGRKLWYDGEMIRVNWDFKPGQSVASTKKAEQFEKLVAATLESYKALGVKITDESRKIAEDTARKSVYGE